MKLETPLSKKLGLKYPFVAAPMFLISTRSEQQISSGFAWAFWVWLIFGLVLAVGGF